MRIGIDIDGVLTNMYEAIINNATRFCYENNIEYKINQTEYNEDKMIGISKLNVEKFWNNYLAKYVQEYAIREGATEIVSKLGETNEIYIITARNEEGLPKELYGTMQNMTKTWLQKNNIKYDKIIFSQDKLTTCVENNVDIMIEDCGETIEKLSKKIKVMCYDAPYNKNVQGDNIIRVYSWFDIMKKIEEYTK